LVGIDRVSGELGFPNEFQHPATGETEEFGDPLDGHE